MQRFSSSSNISPPHVSVSRPSLLKYLKFPRALRWRRKRPRCLRRSRGSWLEHRRQNLTDKLAGCFSQRLDRKQLPQRPLGERERFIRANICLLLYYTGVQNTTWHLRDPRSQTLGLSEHSLVKINLSYLSHHMQLSGKSGHSQLAMKTTAAQFGIKATISSRSGWWRWCDGARKVFLTNAGHLNSNRASTT